MQYCLATPKYKTHPVYLPWEALSFPEMGALALLAPWEDLSLRSYCETQLGWLFSFIYMYFSGRKGKMGEDKFR